MTALLNQWIPSNELIMFNHCRMYLQAILLSDIVAADDTTVSDEAWDGIPVLSAHKQQSWPIFGKPPGVYWDTWRKWVKKTFVSRGRRLRKPLGSWLCMDKSWPWYTSADSLLHYKMGKWFRHPPVIRRNCMPAFGLTSQECNPPMSPCRAKVYLKEDQIVCTGAAPILPNNHSTPDSLKAYIEHDKDLSWCLHLLQVQQGGHPRALLEGYLMAVSDGSYKNSFGTAAWTIGDVEHPSLISGKVICPGEAQDHDLYRSELSGIYAIMAVLDKVVEYFHLQEGTVEIRCNGQAALESIFSRSLVLTKDAASYDLIAATLYMRRKSPLKWIPRYVRGHQDDLAQPLDAWALRNIMIDSWEKHTYLMLYVIRDTTILKGSLGLYG